MKNGPSKKKKAALAASSSQASITTSKTPTDANANSPVYFHREHTPPYGFLSQWYVSPFYDPVAKITYNCAEQRMMHHKALLTGDTASAKLILASLDPAEQKTLGRKVKGWKEQGEEWERIKFETVVEGTWLKFSNAIEHGASLRKKLLDTGERELVEAAGSDRVWGVGYNADQAGDNRDNWGQNLLGKALMIVRDRLREEESAQNAKALDKERGGE